MPSPSPPSFLVVACDQIIFDEDMYPRTTVNFKTVTSYGYAMKAGAKFPPITIATVEGKMTLIDGAHRLQAAKWIEKYEIEAINLGELSRKEAYIEAVKRNITNGLQFSLYEKLSIYARLKKEGWTVEKISGLVYIPRSVIKRYVIQRIVVGPTGESVVLKAPLKHLSGEERNIEDYEQRFISASSQASLIDQLMEIIDKGWLNIKDERITKSLIKLKESLDKIIPTLTT